MCDIYMMVALVIAGLILGAAAGGFLVWKRKQKITKVLDDFYAKRDGLEKDAKEILDRIREVF